MPQEQTQVSDSPGLVCQQPQKGGALKNRKDLLKFRVYRTCLTLASIAVIIEVLGAGRRF
jgi:hypothetical protein